MTKAQECETEAAQDEQAIRALKDVFARGFLTKNPRLRASIWVEDGTLVPPRGGFLRGRNSIEKLLETQIGSVTGDSKMTFSNYRFRFITPDVAFVDVDITLNNVLGSDGTFRAILPISSAFTAIRQEGAWFVQDERAYFGPIPNSGD
jgi:uncharacterized protein (TIGR02246 family)